MAQILDRVLHVRFNGRSEELMLSTLGLKAHASDDEIQRAVARHYDLPAHALDNHIIVRTSQAIIVRPEAIYG